jgi:RNA polymerase sigma-70 factor (ECF subfamily)
LTADSGIAEDQLVNFARAGMGVNATSDAYRDFAPYVRRRLLQLGVRDADLPDQCHEVFLILHKRERLDEIERVDLWLREVCRRVAAAYRRRARNTREVLGGLPSAGVDPSEDPETSLGSIDDRDYLRNALERLDDESRDLLALHDVGEMPLTELAKLVEHDRKTVRKRIEAARHRLSILLQGDPPPIEAGLGAPATSAGQAGGMPRLSDELEVVSVTPGVTIGLVGNVVLTVWPGRADLASIETLATVGPPLIERCGGKISYFATVEDSVRPPELAARKRIVEVLDMWGSHFLAYATALSGKGAWIAKPIMSELVVLIRPRFPMRFFGSVPDAAGWLCTRFAIGAEGPLPAGTLYSAVERLRLLRP